ncbi:hypothetical protein BDZ91DRAFT_766803 [Kalaharituber pfeilii]|nr:hypothetical protein BDZ91DRAFT_766803 [Kalaharituber pfeilii]
MPGLACSCCPALKGEFISAHPEFHSSPSKVPVWTGKRKRYIYDIAGPSAPPIKRFRASSTVLSTVTLPQSLFPHEPPAELECMPLSEESKDVPVFPVMPKGGDVREIKADVPAAQIKASHEHSPATGAAAPDGSNDRDTFPSTFTLPQNGAQHPTASSLTREPSLPTKVSSNVQHPQPVSTALRPTKRSLPEQPTDSPPSKRARFADAEIPTVPSVAVESGNSHLSTTSSELNESAAPVPGQLIQSANRNANPPQTPLRRIGDNLYAPSSTPGLTDDGIPELSPLSAGGWNRQSSDAADRSQLQNTTQQSAKHVRTFGCSFNALRATENFPAAARGEPKIGQHDAIPIDSKYVAYTGASVPRQTVNEARKIPPKGILKCPSHSNPKTTSSTRNTRDRALSFSPLVHVHRIPTTHLHTDFNKTFPAKEIINAEKAMEAIVSARRAAIAVDLELNHRGPVSARRAALAAEIELENTTKWNTVVNTGMKRALYEEIAHRVPKVSITIDGYTIELLDVHGAESFWRQNRGQKRKAYIRREREEDTQEGDSVEPLFDHSYEDSI